MGRSRQDVLAVHTNRKGMPFERYGAIYACLMTDAHDRDHLIYRGGAGPAGAIYERRLTNGGWDLTTKLSVQRIAPGYTFVGATMTIDPTGTIYCGFEYYRLFDNRSLGVCGLKSVDAGETWTGTDGRPARLPPLIVTRTRPISGKRTTASLPSNVKSASGI